MNQGEKLILQKAWIDLLFECLAEPHIWTIPLYHIGVMIIILSNFRPKKKDTNQYFVIYVI